LSAQSQSAARLQLQLGTIIIIIRTTIITMATITTIIVITLITPTIITIITTIITTSVQFFRTAKKKATELLVAK
jgi:hypothetical protein